MTNPLARVKSIVKYISLPTLIIGTFWILIITIGTFNSLSLPVMLSDGIKRFGRWGILTLAMVPAIKSGTGPNFALPIGIVCGLLGEMIAIVMGFTGFAWIIISILFAVLFSSMAGYGYGKLMNAVKGSEMTIATYTGFSITMLFSIIWLVLPFKDPRITWPLGKGTGLRQTIQLDQIKSDQILDNFLFFEIFGVGSPTGM
jgi:simple sugar transport system permease protein